MIEISKKQIIQEANLPFFIKKVWVKRYEKQIQKLHIQTVFLFLTSYTATIIGFTPNNQVNELIIDFFKEYTPDYEGQYFRDWLAFHNQ